MEHEETHAKQQKLYGVEDWWARYLKDDGFRLEMEADAYKKQYEYAKKHYNRDGRRAVLKEIIHNLSSKLYGNIISKQEAKEIIQ